MAIIRKTLKSTDTDAPTLWQNCKECKQCNTGGSYMRKSVILNLGILGEGSEARIRRDLITFLPI